MLLNEMEIFYHVVTQQSFSKAAARLGVSKSFISKRMTKLEHDLQTRLIARSTRKLMLTEAGENFFRQCVQVVQAGEKGYAMMSELSGKPAGVLKISVPPALAVNLLAPFFSEFLTQCPDVKLDVQLENRLVDLVKEGYDLALRSAILESSNLIAQKIFTIKNKICGTKNYFKIHGMPKTPADLMQHNCAVYSDAKILGQIQLVKQNTAETIQVNGNFLSNHLDLIKQMLLQHTCLGVLPEFMVRQELQNNQLVECLADYELPTTNLYAIYPEREFMLPKTSVFLQMLKSYLGKVSRM